MSMEINKKSLNPRHNVNICSAGAIAYNTHQKCISQWHRYNIQSCSWGFMRAKGSLFCDDRWNSLSLTNVAATPGRSFNHFPNVGRALRGFLEATGARAIMFSCNTFSQENKLKWCRKWQRRGDSNYEWQRTHSAAPLRSPHVKAQLHCEFRNQTWQLRRSSPALPHWLSEVLSKKI